MSETKFKVGDIVRRKQDHTIFAGWVGEVVKVEGEEISVKYKRHTWSNRSKTKNYELVERKSDYFCFESRAEPAPAVSEPKAPQPEFKVGDRVRVVAVESAMHKMTGYVKRYDKDLSLPYHVESECMNWDNRFRADELEPAPTVKECLTVDNVNHPPHYNQGGIECIEAIKAATGSGFVKYCTGNVIKYLWRYDNKGGLEDLKKAAWYLDRAIKEMEVSGE
jgi:hypothetical protein